MGLFSRKKLIEPPQPDPNLEAILERLEAISARDEPSTNPEPSLVARIEDVEARMEVFQERVKGYMRTISGQVSKAKQMGASLNDPFEEEEEQTEPVAADVEGNGAPPMQVSPLSDMRTVEETIRRSGGFPL